MRHTPLRLAAALAAAVTAGLIGSAVPLAQAATSNPGIIDPTHTVTLNVYKFLGSPTGLPHNGTQQSVADATHVPLAGVNFDVYKVYTDSARTTAVDLTTNAGWVAAADITGYQVTKSDITNGYFVIGSTTYYLSATATTGTTGTDGLAQFTPLGGVGLYLVNENLASSGTVQQCTDPSTCTTVDKSQVSPVYPFFVTLPMTNPDNLNAWMYDVYVYPKNQAATGTKTVADKNTQTAESTSTGSPDTVTFVISTPITDSMTAAEMQMYQVIDQLDSRLTYGSLTVAVDGDGDGDPSTGTQTALTAPGDYTVGLDPASGPGQKITVSLTSAGLAKLVTANGINAAATVLTTITTTLTGTEGSGAITNHASFIPNQAYYDAHPGSDGTMTNTVTSYYGDLNITKQDPKDGSIKMPNAQFAVYIDPTPATPGGTNTCTATDVTGTTVATGTTDANGLLTIKGLQTSDYYNGADQTQLIYYCLVETKAPSGYNLNAQPISFTILKASISGSNPAFTNLTVNNEKANLGNRLPFTGGQGIALLGVIGALLVAGGLVFHGSSRRQRDSR